MAWSDRHPESYPHLVSHPGRVVRSPRVRAMNILVDERTRAWIERKSRELEISMSEVINRCIAREIRRERKRLEKAVDESRGRGCEGIG